VVIILENDHNKNAVTPVGIFLYTAVQGFGDHGSTCKLYDLKECKLEQLLELLPYMWIVIVLFFIFFYTVKVRAYRC
jgi:hypothetical protein